jgi:hypothetical protein
MTASRAHKPNGAAQAKAPLVARAAPGVSIRMTPKTADNAAPVEDLGRGDYGPPSTSGLCTRGNRTRSLSATELVALVRDTQDRTALYQFGPIVVALCEGRRPRLTRRGLRIFYVHRAAYRVPIVTDPAS